MKNAGVSAVMEPNAGNGGRLAMPRPVSPPQVNRRGADCSGTGAVRSRATWLSARATRRSRRRPGTSALLWVTSPVTTPCVTRSADDGAAACASRSCEPSRSRSSRGHRAVLVCAPVRPQASHRPSPHRQELRDDVTPSRVAAAACAAAALFSAAGCGQSAAPPADSPITDLAGCAGRTVCFVDPNSTSGYLYPTAGLIEAGVDPVNGLTRTFAGGHDASALAVAPERQQRQDVWRAYHREMRSRVGLEQLSEDEIDVPSEPRHVDGHRVPADVQVDLEVVVHHSVPHADHLSPGHRRVRSVSRSTIEMRLRR
jgi:hypothetical protein